MNEEDDDILTRAHIAGGVYDSSFDFSDSSVSETKQFSVYDISSYSTNIYHIHKTSIQISPPNTFDYASTCLDNPKLCHCIKCCGPLIFYLRNAKRFLAPVVHKVPSLFTLSVRKIKKQLLNIKCTYQSSTVIYHLDKFKYECHQIYRWKITQRKNCACDKKLLKLYGLQWLSKIPYFLKDCIVLDFTTSLVIPAKELKLYKNFVSRRILIFLKEFDPEYYSFFFTKILCLNKRAYPCSGYIDLKQFRPIQRRGFVSIQRYPWFEPALDWGHLKIITYNRDLRSVLHYKVSTFFKSF